MSFLSGTGNFDVAQKSLDALWMKQKVISSNIANVDTPGYKSKSVEFESLLQNASDMDQLQQKIVKTSPKVIENDATQLREDGNNVDIDEENIELTRTQLQYEYMSGSLSRSISRLKYVINEGRA